MYSTISYHPVEYFLCTVKMVLKKSSCRMQFCIFIIWCTFFRLKDWGAVVCCAYATLLKELSICHLIFPLSRQMLFFIYALCCRHVLLGHKFCRCQYSTTVIVLDTTPTGSGVWLWLWYGIRRLLVLYRVAFYMWRRDDNLNHQTQTSTLTL